MQCATFIMIDQDLMTSCNGNVCLMPALRHYVGEKSHSTDKNGVVGFTKPLTQVMYQDIQANKKDVEFMLGMIAVNTE